MCLETKKGQSGICVILKSQWCHSVVVNHADIGSNTCHTRNSIVEEATVNYPIESTFLEETQSLFLVSATLEINYATQGTSLLTM